MAFRTKLDFSNNRQVKQFEKTQTVLSGGTSFGLTFSELTSGPNPITSGETGSISLIASTFSGTSATTVYNWYDPAMSLAEPYFSALTPSNSAITQNVISVFAPETTTIIDGNTVVLSYSGVGFDITPIAMYELGGGNYSGTVETLDLVYYSATSLDYTGRTIWVDVSGITRTEKLIITDTPQVGYVFGCLNSEGLGGWIPSPSSGETIWVRDIGFNSAVLSGSGSIASGGFSLAEGAGTTASGLGSHSSGNKTVASGDSSFSIGDTTIAGGEASFSQGVNTKAFGISSIAGGSGTTANGNVSFVFGSNSIANNKSVIVLGDNITGSTGNSTYVERLSIKNYGPYVNDAAADADTTLPSGGLYTLVGSRAVYIKP